MTQADRVSQTVPMPAFDLRRMPAGADAGDGFLGQRLGASHHPQWVFWRAAGAGRAGRFSSQARHLVVIVLDGRLTLQDGATAIRLVAGDSALIAPGTSFDWQSTGESDGQNDGQALWIVNGYTDQTTANRPPPGIARIDRNAAQRPSPSPAQHLLVGPAPDCTKLELAASGDDRWSAGLWTATPYERIPVRYGYYEMMHLHAGAVTVFDETGATMTFREGDLFLMPEGVVAGWRSTADVRKLWSIFTPAAT